MNKIYYNNAVINNMASEIVQNNKIPPNLKAVIFDLDDTLRRNNQMFNLDKDIIDILNYLKNNNIILALASLNPWAPYLLQEYKVSHLFNYICCNNFNIENCDKTQMFLLIMQNSGIPAENIIFFDDLQIHIQCAMKLGIKSILVKSLLNWNDIKNGFDLFYDH